MKRCRHPKDGIIYTVVISCEHQSGHAHAWCSNCGAYWGYGQTKHRQWTTPKMYRRGKK